MTRRAKRPRRSHPAKWPNWQRYAIRPSAWFDTPVHGIITHGWVTTPWGYVVTGRFPKSEPGRLHWWAEFIYNGRLYFTAGTRVLTRRGLVRTARQFARAVVRERGL